MKKAAKIAGISVVGMEDSLGCLLLLIATYLEILKIVKVVVVSKDLFRKVLICFLNSANGLIVKTIAI